MKRWTRAFLAILLGVFGAAYVGMVPAQAANRDSKPDTVITYRGYTLSWSEPDASDLRVVKRRVVPRAFRMPPSSEASSKQSRG